MSPKYGMTWVIVGHWSWLISHCQVVEPSESKTKKCLEGLPDFLVLLPDRVKDFVLVHIASVFMMVLMGKLPRVVWNPFDKETSFCSGKRTSKVYCNIFK